MAGKSSSEKESTTCELSEQAEIVKNSLLQNIRIVNSSNSKFTDSYLGISSLLNSFKKHKDTYDGGEGKTGLTFNEESLKFSIKKYRDIYSLNEFSCFFHRTVDSEPIPLIFDPNLDFEIYDKEAEIYKNNYISVKAKPNLNTNEKYVLIDNLNALHAGIKASQGSFSLPFDGWLVDQGQRVSIDAATVAGDKKYGAKFDNSSNIVQYYLYAENDSAGSFSPERAEYEYYTISSHSFIISFGNDSVSCIEFLLILKCFSKLYIFAS